MKILEIGMTDKLGGTEMYFYNYYHKFNESFHFDFIDMYNGMYFAGEYEKNGSKIIKVPFFKKHPLKCFFSIRKAVSDYDLVHINTLSAANIVPLLAAKSKGKTVAVHCHNSGMPVGAARRLLHKINKPVINLLADKRFACSELAGKWLFGDKPFTVIPNAMDFEKYAFNEEIRKETREKYGFGNATVLGHVGRFQEQKNHKYLVKIFSEYHKLDPDSKLMLVGQGELFDEIKNKLDGLGLLKDVVFIKESREPEKLYQAMDVFVFPSLFEGLSLVAIEAQLSGLKCLFSDTISRETQISNNVEFIGIEEKDISVWVNEILQKRDSGRAEKLPEKESVFNIENGIKVFEEALRNQ